MTTHEPLSWSLPAERTSAAAAWHPRRCAIAAATVVVVGTVPMIAHAATDDASNAATRRLIDSQLTDAAAKGPATFASTTVIAGGDDVPASPANTLLVAQQAVPPADSSVKTSPAATAPAAASPMPAVEAAPPAPRPASPSPTVILPPGTPAPDTSAQAPAMPSGPSAQGPGALEPLQVSPEAANAAATHAAGNAPDNAPVGAMPTDRQAFHDEVMRESREGAATLAQENLRQHPDWFKESESWHVDHAAAAQRIRWGRQQLKVINGPERFVIIDQAVAEIEALLKKVPDTPENAEFRQQIVADEVVALASRGRMKDAVKRYEAMSQTGKVPAYTRVAAGDAYAYLDTPDKAADAYARALKDASPGEIETGDVQEGLFYAMLDTGRFEEARALLDKMKADNPEYVRLAPEAGTPNPDYSRIKRLEAQYLILTGRTHQGIAELDKWRHEAPFAASLVSARADGAMVQTEPYRSRDMYKTALAEHPDDLSVVAGYGRASLAVDDLKTAKNVANGLDERFPENGSVRALRKDLDVYQSPQLIIQSTADKGNSAFANNEYGIDTKAYSGPFADHYRLFFHNFAGRAQFDGASESRVRNGAGLQWFDTGVEVNGEVHQSVGAAGKTGGTLDATWIPSDHWKVSGMVTNDDLEVPYKAYQVGVTGKSVSGNVRYTWDETRYASLTYGVSRYTDDNLRQRVAANFYQQVFTSPRHTIGVLFGADTSRNTMTGLNYFSPSRDYSGQATAIWSWTPWRYADKSFTQRVYLTGGMYNQQSFGSSPMVEARLEHVWQINRKTQVSYGIGFGRHRYDGQPENRKFLYLNLNIPL
ncbi:MULTISPECIES: poly-beta-1,6 N-acetyl-D-glucosamine export porin PgaA [Ralstonia]|uniref:poly-beta-1,6 N-acetyl-D-glucosamine export porin PgaA n=1 Tax=Ralstonia wenshanensis TaxID=2842456 RepID=UPI0021B45BBB|nr:poly-beta-1,6 N-acetyl-D-glucosamine export porin PgaA [Ralstonia wenshanensis]MCT7308016.1 poly-beta-1,6 N-acetyl-D-glucosamine export porin PgaA [Ralstonia wenshanensis]